MMQKNKWDLSEKYQFEVWETTFVNFITIFGNFDQY